MRLLERAQQLFSIVAACASLAPAKNDPFLVSDTPLFSAGLRVILAQRVKVLSSANSRNQTTLIVAARSGQAEIAQAVIRLVGEDWVPSDDEVGACEPPALF